MAATQGYRFVDHDADLGIEILAADLLAVWDLSARALVEVMTDASTVAEELSVDLEVAGPDLLAAWIEALGELLFQFEVDGVLLRAVADLEWADGAEGVQVRFTARGQHYDPARHPARTAVKAVTHHGAVLEQREEGWYARTLLDL